jgi:hypothetical protein
MDYAAAGDSAVTELIVFAVLAVAVGGYAYHLRHLNQRLYAELEAAHLETKKWIEKATTHERRMRIAIKQAVDAEQELDAIMAEGRRRLR